MDNIKYEEHPFFTRENGKRCIYDPETKRIYNLEDILLTHSVAKTRKSVESVLKEISSWILSDYPFGDTVGDEFEFNITEIRKRYGITNENK